MNFLSRIVGRKEGKIVTDSSFESCTESAKRSTGLEHAQGVKDQRSSDRWQDTNRDALRLCRKTALSSSDFVYKTQALADCKKINCKDGNGASWSTTIQTEEETLPVR